MNPMLDWGIHFIAALQAAAPWLQLPSKFFSFLGTEEFYLLVLPFLYWCVDVRLGVQAAVILTLSGSFNHFFKFAFHQPRPYWVSDQVQAMAQELQYGLPSGHAQQAMSIWGLIGASAKGWLRWLMAAIIFCIGFSRIFLAVHFPTDVLAGWLIGGVILWAFLKWRAPVMAWFNRWSLAQKIGLAFVASLLMLSIAVAGLAFVPPADPPEWEAMAARAIPPAPDQPATNPRDIGSEVGVVGTLFGFAAGALLLFHQSGFDARCKGWKMIARFALGALGVAILWLGLRLVFPRDASLVSQVLRYMRYALTGFWAAYGAPRVFIRLKL